MTPTAQTDSQPNATSSLDCERGSCRTDSPSRVGDDELELHIENCTHLMELAWERWERDGCFSARGEADRWMRLRDDAVRSRSAAQVARLEAQRGLA